MQLKMGADASLAEALHSIIGEQDDSYIHTLCHILIRKRDRKMYGCAAAV